MINNRKVLVVNRDADTAYLLAERLRRFGLEVVCATDGLEAWDRLADRPMPGLVISGLSLPQINGAELARASVAQGMSVPFILFTSDPAGARAQLEGYDARVFDKLDGLEQLVDYVSRIALRVA